MGDPSDHTVSVPASRHTITVPGCGTAEVLELISYVTGAGVPTSVWNWGCNHDGCEVGALGYLDRDEADGDATGHLTREHARLTEDVVCRG